jgi:hypothetical protein
MDPIGCILSVDGRGLTIEPVRPLEYATDYTLTLKATIEGMDYGPLREPVKFTFRTQDQTLPFDVPPFDVVRHGITMNGVWANDEGAIAVGEHGLVLLSTKNGRFVLKIPAEELANADEVTSISDVWVSGHGTAWVIAKGNLVLGPNTIESCALLRFQDGVVREMDTTLVGEFSDKPEEMWLRVHGTESGRIFAATVLNVEVWRPTSPNLMSAGLHDSGTGATEIVDVWARSNDVVYAAAWQGIFRGVPLGPDVSAHRWEHAGWTPVPCTAISGYSDLNAVGIALDTTVWIDGSDVDHVHTEGVAWSDISWADENWCVQVGKDSEGAYSQLFDDPLVDRESRFAVRGKRIPTKEELRAVAAWTVRDPQQGTTHRYAMTVGEAGVEYRLVDRADDPNDGEWSEDGLHKRDSTGGIPVWTDISVAPDVLDAVLYGLRGGQVVKCSLSLPGFPGTLLPRPGDLVPYDIFCTGEDDVWITGIERGGFDWFVSHFDGQSWTNTWLSSLDQPRDLWVWKGETDNVFLYFVACDNGVVYGGARGMMSAVTPPQHLYGIWGSSHRSVWVCGANATVSHYEAAEDGTWSWTKVPLDSITNVHLWAIDGSGEDNVVAVGEFGTVIRYKDGKWSDFSPPASLAIGNQRLTMVAALQPDDIWVASEEGIVLHWDGNIWVKWHIGIPSRLKAIWGRDRPNGQLWLAGEDDLLLRRADPPPVLPLIER